MSDLHGRGEHVSVCFHTCVYRCWFHGLCSMNTHDHWCGGWCAADTGALSVLSHAHLAGPRTQASCLVGTTMALSPPSSRPGLAQMNPRHGLQEHRAEGGPAPGPGSCQQMATSAGPNLTPWGSSEPMWPTGPWQPVGLAKPTAGPLYAAVTMTTLLSETPPGCKRAESECSKSKWADCGLTASPGRATAQWPWSRVDTGRLRRG